MQLNSIKITANDNIRTTS